MNTQLLLHSSVVLLSDPNFTPNKCLLHIEQNREEPVGALQFATLLLACLNVWKLNTQPGLVGQYMTRS